MQLLQERPASKDQWLVWKLIFTTALQETILRYNMIEEN